MEFIDLKGALRDCDFLNIISYSMYKPTEKKLIQFVARFESDKDIFAFAARESGLTIGAIVLRRLSQSDFEITNIAVLPEYRNKGVASSLISFCVGAFNCKRLKAETDDGAVLFYRKYGFAVESLGEKYPGFIRYLCVLNLS